MSDTPHRSHDLPVDEADVSLRCSWRYATGLTLDLERTLDSRERRPYLKRLYYFVNLRLRAAVNAQTQGDLPEEACQFWNPIPGICNDISIAPGRLNSLLKEHTGMTATQMYDRTRCWRQKLEDQLKAEVVKFIRATFRVGSGADADHEVNIKELELKFWRAWKDHRRSSIGWDNSEWALQYGFSSYARFRRAIVLAYGKTPIQLEAQVFREAALYFRAAHSLERRYYLQDYCRKHNEQNAPEYPTRYGSVDHYVQMQTQNPDFWDEQHALYGLPENLAKVAPHIVIPETENPGEILNPYADRPIDPSINPTPIVGRVSDPSTPSPAQPELQNPPSLDTPTPISESESPPPQ